MREWKTIQVLFELGTLASLYKGYTIDEVYKNNSNINIYKSKYVHYSLYFKLQDILTFLDI